jgi:hypothetical protein
MEALHPLFALTQHAPAICVPLTQVLNLGASPQALWGPRAIQSSLLPALASGQEARGPGSRPK